jgi:hypothetical protein
MPEQLDGVVLTPSILFFAVIRSAARKADATFCNASSHSGGELYHH